MTHHGFTSENFTQNGLFEISIEFKCLYTCQIQVASNNQLNCLQYMKYLLKQITYNTLKLNLHNLHTYQCLVNPKLMFMLNVHVRLVYSSRFNHWLGLFIHVNISKFLQPMTFTIKSNFGFTFLQNLNTNLFAHTHTFISYLMWYRPPRSIKSVQRRE